MPSRYVREGLLDSEKIRQAGEPAEVLFMRLLLVVDDFARFDGRVTVICRRCWPIGGPLEADVLERLTTLAQFGLVVCYEVDGKPYLYVPNFNQRTRASKSKYPPPPVPQVSDKSAMPDKPPTVAEHQSAPRQAKEWRKPDDRQASASGVRYSSIENGNTPPSPPLSSAPVDNPGDKPKARVTGRWWTTEGVTAKATELGIAPRRGESTAAFAERLREAVAQRKAEAKGKREPKVEPAAPASPPAARPTTMPLAWTPGYSLVQQAQQLQPTWTSDHVANQAEAFREGSKGRQALDWDDAFLDWVGAQPALPPAVQPEVKRGNGKPAEEVDAWWDDPEQLLSMGGELNVHAIGGQDFEEYRLRVIAASGPGPWFDSQDDESQRKIQRYQREGVNPPPPAPDRPAPVPKR